MILLLDTETTGNAATRVCQLSYLMVENGEVVRAANHYFKVRRMGAYAQKVHGLSVAELRMLSGGKGFADSAQQIFQDFLSADVLVGHHLRCDMLPMEAEFARAGYTLPPRQKFCTLYGFMHEVNMPTKGGQVKHPSLGDLCQKMDVAPEIVEDAARAWFGQDTRPHDARYDVSATWLCLKEAMARGLVCELDEKKRMSAVTGKQLFRWEMHTHTSPASSCAGLPAGAVIERLRRAGYRGAVITDHYAPEVFVGARSGKPYQEALHRLFAGYRAAAARGKQLDMDILPAIELCLTEGPEDYLIYGVDEIILGQVGYLCGCSLQRVREILAPYGALIVQAHPYRKGLCVAQADLLDGTEVYNGNPRRDSQNHLALAYAQEHALLMIRGSDIHHSEDIGGTYMLLPHMSEVAQLPQALKLYAGKEPEDYVE